MRKRTKKFFKFGLKIEKRNENFFKSTRKQEKNPQTIILKSNLH